MCHFPEYPRQNKRINIVFKSFSGPIDLIIEQHGQGLTRPPMATSSRLIKRKYLNYSAPCLDDGERSFEHNPLSLRLCEIPAGPSSFFILTP
jgi:hypothetical protein